MQNIAFAGFRHAHIFDLLQRIPEHPQLRLAGTSEEHFKASLMPSKGMVPDYTSLAKMLAGADFQILALGDCYGRRGAQAIAALEAGRHVIADKPLCTRLEELDKIEMLSSKNGLCVGLMLDLRDHGNWIAMRDVVRSGRIGEIQTISFAGQHPLLPAERPGWYFEPGMHGGTLNDISVHAMDFIPWITGLSIDKIEAARTWNAKAVNFPHFRDCGQIMLRLSNGAGVLGDVSYLAPDTCGYRIPNYWRLTAHGTRGFAETSFNARGVTIADDSFKEPEILARGPGRPGGYLEDFLACVRGETPPGELDTAACLSASRMALELEAAAR